MILTVLVNKVKSFILVFVNLFRRALCCFRRRRRSSCDSVPLTHVISNSEGTKGEVQNWGDWENNDVNSKPKTVQDHIELYRKQALVARQGQETSDPKEQLNFFEDMTPKITKQTKILINTDHRDNGSSSNRLNFSVDPMTAVPTLELKEWEETGWEGETLDHDAQKVLREKKRVERERRAWEQQQKRQEKMNNRFLGSKLST